MKQKCIYQIKCNDPNSDLLYIGSTSNFNVRKAKHKFNSAANGKYDWKLYKYIRAFGGWDNFTMSPIQDCNDLNHEELFELEGIYIELDNPNLNTKKGLFLDAEYEKKRCKMKVQCEICGFVGLIKHLKRHQRSTTCQRSISQ